MIQWMLAIWSLVPLLFKSSLNIWKFSVHVQLKPSLENFEHYFASMWNECNCVVVWTFLALPFFEIEMKTDLFQSCGHCWVFQICWHIECSTFPPSSFRIWKSSTGVTSPSLALFVVLLPKAHLTSRDSMVYYLFVCLFVFGFGGPSFLCVDFLQLQWVGSTLVVVWGLLIGLASLVAEHRL